METSQKDWTCNGKSPLYWSESSIPFGQSKLHTFFKQVQLDGDYYALSIPSEEGRCCWKDPEKPDKPEKPEKNEKKSEETRKVTIQAC